MSTQLSESAGSQRTIQHSPWREGRTQSSQNQLRVLKWGKVLQIKYMCMCMRVCMNVCIYITAEKPSRPLLNSPIFKDSKKDRIWFITLVRVLALAIIKTPKSYFYVIPICHLSYSTASPKHWPASSLLVGPNGTCRPKATVEWAPPLPLWFPMASAQKTNDFTSSLVCPTGKTYGRMISW